MNEQIYCCVFKEFSDNRNILPELLAALELSSSSWYNPENRMTLHTVYASSQKEADEICAQIDKLYGNWREFGIKIEDIETLVLKREDWSETWKRFFQVQRVSRRLVIKPVWREFLPDQDDVVIEINPGMSFGTGQHATTKFCLAALDRLAEEQGGGRSFLDVGCGSGILSIAAVKLGFCPVFAFDVDPDAVTVARENCGLNGIAATDINLQEADISVIKTANRVFDVVAANILAPVLIKNRERLVQLICSGGFLILAGILEREYAEVRQLFTAQGMKEIETLIDSEWQGGLFRKI